MSSGACGCAGRPLLVGGEQVHRRVPSPRCSRSATRGLRGLCRLPLPWANSTLPPSPRERGQAAAERPPPPTVIRTAASSTGCGRPTGRPAEPVWIAPSIAPPGERARVASGAYAPTRTSASVARAMPSAARAALVQLLLRRGRAGHARDGELQLPAGPGRASANTSRTASPSLSFGRCPTLSWSTSQAPDVSTMEDAPARVGDAMVGLLTPVGGPPAPGGHRAARPDRSAWRAEVPAPGAGRGGRCHGRSAPGS